MRLKSSNGPLSVSVYNGNDSILNSPKRINTLQNSNITNRNTNITLEITDNNINSNDIISTTADITEALNNVNTADSVQWCNSALIQDQQLTNNAKNRSPFNINNNTLAASLRGTRYATASSVCSESSPDDSLLEYEEAHQSSSSIDASPQDEDRGFDVSDTESLSDEVNLNAHETLQRRGIVNPNYPGFQHLAHTLDYGIKVSSDTDFTDDDLEYESASKLKAEANNINNNNNNNEDEVEYKIDSVNRLNSVENIQKVFYDKPVFNIPLQCDGFKCNNYDVDVASGTNSHSKRRNEDDSQVVTPNVCLNIQSNEKIIKTLDEPAVCNIVGDFGKEIHEELKKLNKSSSYTELNEETLKINEIVCERAIEEELKEAIEKLSALNDFEPSATRCKIEPNTGQPFNKKVTKTAVISSVIAQESTTVKLNDIDMTTAQISSQNNKPNNRDNMDAYNIKISDAFLSGAYENISALITKSENLFQETDLNANSDETKITKMDVDLIEKQDNEVEKEINRKSMIETDEFTKHKINAENRKSTKIKELLKLEELEKFCKEEKTKNEAEKDEDTVVPRKKEKMESNYVKKRRDYNQQFGSLITVPRKEYGGRIRDAFNRRSAPGIRDKKKHSSEALGGFDVYNIETAMPKIDLDAIESHLRAAREEERRRRTDREEIRRRLAMGSEDDYYSDRPGRKPSLQARLQSGMNLQICFMNETASDTDSPSSDSECPMTNPKEQRLSPKIKKISTPTSNTQFVPPIRPATLSIGQPLIEPTIEPMTETDFFTKQARLQTEARMALAQAKEMARMQMEIEKQKQVKSPITEMIRHSLEKIGIPFPEGRRRLSRQILTEMNVAQLQVIVNDLHTQIETLNEVLVKYLMNRDDLHMEQDSMLVDIEDLTRYLGAKEQTLKEHNVTSQNNNLTPATTLSSPARSPLAALNSSVKPHLHRIANLVKK